VPIQPAYRPVAATSTASHRIASLKIELSSPEQCPTGAILGAQRVCGSDSPVIKRSESPPIVFPSWIGACDFLRPPNRYWRCAAGAGAFWYPGSGMPVLTSWSRPARSFSVGHGKWRTDVGCLCLTVLQNGVCFLRCHPAVVRARFAAPSAEKQ
jgi:hypothetical protein